MPVQFQAKLNSEYITAKIPPIGPTGTPQQLPPQRGNESDGAYVYYTKGFGETPFQDHTSVGRRCVGLSVIQGPVGYLSSGVSQSPPEH